MKGARWSGHHVSVRRADTMTLGTPVDDSLMLRSLFKEQGKRN